MQTIVGGKQTVTESEYDANGNLILQIVTENYTPIEDVPESSVPEPYVISFYYDGSIREVQNPQIVEGAYNYTTGSYNALLAGVELTRAGRETGEYKNFLLSKIGPV